LYRETLVAGAVPLVDAQIKTLPLAEDGTTWEARLTTAAGEMARKGRGADALAIATQCSILSGGPLARQAYAQFAAQVGTFPIGLRFAVAVFLARIGERTPAEE